MKSKSTPRSRTVTKWDRHSCLITSWWTKIKCFPKRQTPKICPSVSNRYSVKTTSTVLPTMGRVTWSLLGTINSPLTHILIMLHSKMLHFLPKTYPSLDLRAIFNLTLSTLPVIMVNLSRWNYKNNKMLFTKIWWMGTIINLVVGIKMHNSVHVMCTWWVREGLISSRWRTLNIRISIWMCRTNNTRSIWCRHNSNICSNILKCRFRKVRFVSMISIIHKSRVVHPS